MAPLQAPFAHPLRVISMAYPKRFFTVLVVDDEALLRWSIAELLRRGGHTVIEAASAVEDSFLRPSR